MPHFDHQIFSPLPGYVEEPGVLSLLGRRLAALPGRVAVVMDPVPETFAGSSILVPEGKHSGKFRPDAGTVVASGVSELRAGDRVLVKPYDGLWMTDKDADWVPEGREVRFYGVADYWGESVVAKL